MGGADDADAGGDEGDYGRGDGGTDNDSVHCEQSSWGFACPAVECTSSVSSRLAAVGRALPSS